MAAARAAVILFRYLGIGTLAVLKFTDDGADSGGTQFPVVSDYREQIRQEVDCPSCHAHYECDPFFLLDRISAGDAASVSLIHEAEKDHADD